MSFVAFQLGSCPFDFPSVSRSSLFTEWLCCSDRTSKCTRWKLNSLFGELVPSRISTKCNDSGEHSHQSLKISSKGQVHGYLCTDHCIFQHNRRCLSMFQNIQHHLCQARNSIRQDIFMIESATELGISYTLRCVLHQAIILTFAI